MVKLILLLAFVAHTLVLASSTRYYPRNTPRGRSVRCPRNEIWAYCPEAVCKPKTCNDVGFEIPCFDLNRNGTCPGRPYCICKEGFVRNYRGICIPMEFCPSCGGDPNARSGCGTNCNRLCSNYYKKDVFCTEECLYNACDCKDGFVYDEIRRKCVRPNQCRPPPICRKRNEVYDPCPSSCPARTCGINDTAVSCAPPLLCGHPKCPPPTCRCRNGFYRNHRGDCVRWENCPTCLRPNEVYDPCPAPCPPKVCGVDETLLLCQVPPQLGSPECKPGCRCKDGFVKNQSNICIPKDECPVPCNGDPNAVSGCGVYCNQRCRDIGKKPGPCILICYPDSCDCLDGYYLDENTGKCVLPEQCTYQCPINEVYSECIQGNCRPQNCNQLGFPVPCPRIDPRYCRKGCLCKEGYVRNYKGVCIPSVECPSCQGDRNKVAGCGVYCNQRCKDIGKEPNACIEVCYENSCNCRDGYYLDDSTGFCVLPKQCTPQCGRNETYSSCIQGNCSPQTCSELKSPLACPRIDPKYCKKGCVCLEGYVRNDEGNCIAIFECPKPCDGDPNKVPGCGTYCNQRCRNIGNEPEFCTDICYENACNCKDGYYLDENTGFCVLPEKCTRQCPENEFYSECTQGNCSPDKCTEVGFPIACPRIDPRYCKKGCLCKQGYARNGDGICIPSNECPSCGGDPNAQPGCGGNCNRQCSDIGQEPKACILICEFNGCNCKDGYYYDNSSKKCVLPEQCPPNCGINEEYNDCINSYCDAQTCDDLGFPTGCTKMDRKYCKKGCRCKSGYVRNSNGVCIPSNECPSCGRDPNAQPGCGGNCNKHCYDIGKETSFCALSCILNGCDCKDGYYYDNYTKKCVEPQDCTQICSANEVYSDCIQGGCQARNCSQYGKPIPCVKIDPKYCKKGCVCKDTYLRASNGQCVPEKNCPEACTGPNEEYKECSWSCPPQTCNSIGKAYACPLQSDSNCSPMCKCKSGFYRDNIGQCITEKQCKQCSGPHEYYSCGGACDNVCATLDEQSQDNCPIVNIKCNEMCYCEKGYARARNNTCIPIDSCDSDNRVCGAYEVYEDCSNPVCKAQRCTDLGFPLDCKSGCKKGCICQDGYVRDKNGRCIPTNECPSCGGDPNAVTGCGVNCGRQCSNIGKKGPVACPAICKQNGCDCREGFYYNGNISKCVKPEDCYSCGGDPNARSGCGVNCGRRCRDLVGVRPCPRICNVDGCDCIDGFYFDSNQKKCVPADQCTDICPKNEVLEDCSNPTCKAKTCSQVGFPLDCNETCVKGCVCQNGYVRNGDGVCIPINQCPSCGGDPNAHSGCGTNCGRRCPNNYINPKFCPRIACVPELNKCDCNDGLYFDINTKNCVTLEECSPRCDASNNEVYDSCVNGGCGWRNCSQVGGPILCIDPIKCNKGCKCKDGYYRLDNGTCVPEKSCPNYVSCGGDPNAQPGCGYNCGKRCPNNYINPKLCPRIRCIPNKCDCKDGFYFDINTKSCVKLENCTPSCNDQNNEVYVTCPPICPPQTCESIGQKYFCPRTNATGCHGQCRCKPKFYRNIIGQCICEEDCLKCRGPNEYFSCGPACDNECDKLNKQSKDNCPIKNIKCVEKCYCEDGYARNASGICIPINQCPPCENSPSEDYDYFFSTVKCKGPNEYFSCGSECDNVCGKLDTASKDNCPIKNKKCVSKCYCKDGFARNRIGICIPINQCPVCDTTPSTTTTQQPVSLPNALAKFERGNQALAGQFIYYLLQSRPGENFMISGFSVLVALAQLSPYAVGEALEQLTRVLNLTNDEIRVVFPELMKQYKEQQGVTIEVAVKYFSDKKTPFSDNFIQDSKAIFDSQVESLDFYQSDLAANIINSWVEDNTNGLIKNLVNADMFNKDTRCVLVNALYFLGNWENQFKEENTEPRDFYVDKDNTVSVDTMYQKGKFEYGESAELGCQIVKLPYKKGNFSFLVLLPKEKCGLQNLAENLKESDKLAKSINQLNMETVEIYLPVMDFETTISDLLDLLRKLGLTDAVDPRSGSYKGIMASGEPLSITGAVQKTMLKVNEKGTEAAAATAIMAGATAVFRPTKEYIVDCNQPFVYILQLQNFPMFYGVYSGKK